MKRIPFPARALVLLVVSIPPASRAEDLARAGFRPQASGPTRIDSGRQPEWGTTAPAIRTIHGLGFQAAESTTAYTYDSTTTYRFKTGGSPFFDAPLTDLPAGAELTGLELEGCDTSGTEQVIAFLLQRPSPGGGTSIVHTVATGAVATDGCGFYGSLSNIAPGNFVDNLNNLYWVRVNLGADDNTTQLGAVRVYYRLRIRPAPAVATFADVPTTHPFFAAIEALAASGITSGCGAGTFCPSGTVSRAEMAAFLARALGLHFPY